MLYEIDDQSIERDQKGNHKMRWLGGQSLYLKLFPTKYQKGNHITTGQEKQEKNQAYWKNQALIRGEGIGQCLEQR